MIIRRTLTETNSLNRAELKRSKLILQYTILFALMTAGLFAVLALFNKSLMEYNDGYRQGYFLTAELRHFLKSLFSGQGFPLWSWSKGLGMSTDWPTDPLNVIAALFPPRFTELGFSIAAALRLYFGGLTFLIFTKENRLGDFQSLFGAILYTYSSWFIGITFTQNSFVVGAYMIPLLALGVDYIYRDRTPALFICSVAYYLMRDAYAAYMAAIVIILYLALRYFHYNDKFSPVDYCKSLVRFVIYGLVGILISSITLLQTVLSIMRASTENSKAGGLDIFYNADFYLGLGKSLVSTGITDGYTYLGFPILVLLIFPIAIKRFNIKNTSLVMSILLLIMMMFPFFSSMFNGFNYPSARWYFAIIFFVSWAATECLDIELLTQKGNLILMGSALVVLVIWTLGFYGIGLISMSMRSLAFVLMSLAGGFAIILVLGCWPKHKAFRRRQLALICISSLTIIACWSLNIYVNIDKFIGNGEVYNMLSKSTQRVSPKLDSSEIESNEDKSSDSVNSFYRTDQVDWINLNKDMGYPVNENLWWQSKSIYQYDSMISSKQLEFNRLVGNNYGYSTRVYSLSNGNRMGLDFLYGVKYFLGDDTKNDRTGSDQYAGYGFKSVGNIDGVNIFENKYDTGLGFGYDAVIKESEFEKLGRLEREEALLQAAVLPDETVDSLTKADASTSESPQVLGAEDIDLDVIDLDRHIKISDPTVEETKRFETPGCNTGDVKQRSFAFASDGENTAITIDLQEITDSQLVVSFDNLRNTKGKAFSIYCSNDRLTQTAKTYSSNQAIANVTDFDLNMGYYDSFDGTLEITLPYAADYECDGLHVYAMSAHNYDKYARARMAYNFDVDKYDDDCVTGHVNMPKAGILYLSIPQYENWNIYVDGTKQEKLEDVNIAFMGVQVDSGNHQIELRYEDRAIIYGLILSLVGLCMLITICVLRRRGSLKNMPKNIRIK